MAGNVNRASDMGYKKGFFDGMPICLGYIPIALAYGISASKLGINFWVSQLMSFGIYSGSGQLAVLNLIEGGEISVITFALTLFVINCRYLLISIATAQRLDPNMNVLQRFIFGLFNTDEVYAIANQSKGTFSTPYLFGLITMPFFGWMFGSMVGCLFNNILPKSVSDALGIVLSAMIIALVIPASKKSKQVLFVVVNAILLSVLLECNPVIKQVIKKEWVIIICAVVSAIMGSVFFPVDNSSDDEEVSP